MPTRAGRHGQAYTSFGRLNLRNARFADDSRPLDDTSSCPASTRYSRAYLHHLVKSGELLGMMILSWANLGCYQELMQGIRKALAEGQFAGFYQETKERWERARIDEAR